MAIFDFGTMQAIHPADGVRPPCLWAPVYQASQTRFSAQLAVGLVDAAKRAVNDCQPWEGVAIFDWQSLKRHNASNPSRERKWARADRNRRAAGRRNQIKSNLLYPAWGNTVESRDRPARLAALAQVDWSSGPVIIAAHLWIGCGGRFLATSSFGSGAR